MKILLNKALIICFLLFYSISYFAYGIPKSMFAATNIIVDIYAKFDNDADLDKYLSLLKLKKGHGINVGRFELLSIIDSLAKEDKVSIGGSLLNSVLNISGLGVKSYITGAVGDDKFGEFAISEIKQRSVNAVIYDKCNATNIVLVLIDKNGERSFIISADCALHAVNHHQKLNKDSIFAVDGYLLEYEDFYKKVSNLFLDAKSRGATTLFTLGDKRIVEFFKNKDVHFMDYVDIVVGNKDEFFALTNTKTLGSMISKLVLSKKLNLVTLGESGALVVDVREGYSKKSIFKVAKKETDVIDTTGAGDAFVSGFIYGYANGYSIESSSFFGIDFASSVLSQIGGVLPKQKLFDKRFEYSSYSNYG